MTTSTQQQRILHIPRCSDVLAEEGRRDTKLRSRMTKLRRRNEALKEE
jgi:hypothetical protein